jgi:hypothetical protein
MCIVSFDIGKVLNITIRNLCPDLELLLPVYFNNGSPCHISPSQQTDIGTIIEAGFRIDSEQKIFRGVLLYKLRRKHTTKTGKQLNSGMASINNTAKNMYLLVAWDFEHYYRNSCACLLECDDDFIWDEDKLWALHRKYKRRFYENYKSSVITWSIGDSAVMKTRFNVTYGSDYKFDIVISEGTRRYKMKEPLKISSKRSVLSLLTLPILIVLLVFPFNRQLN